MRILHLTPDPPAPGHINGGTTRQYHLYRRLLELGHEVTVVAPFPYTDSPYMETLRDEGFVVHGYARPKSRMREVFQALVRRPSLLLAALRLSINGLIGAVYWARLRPIARDVLAGGQFDVINVEQEFAAQWIGDLSTDLPKVLTSHQVESAYRFERAERRRGLARKLALIDAKRSQQSERRWTPRFDAVVCMSEREIELLTESVGQLPPAYAIGNGADLEWLSDLPPDPREQRVLFTGTMSFEPNALGAEFLARDVMPLVRDKLPDATLDVVGRNPGPATRVLGDLDGVTVHGSVPDMKPFFGRASICTLPMLEGGGTRLKLAEAFAARRAVVATTNGATGVETTDGEDIVIADGAVAFAAAIVDLLNDDARRAQIAEAGHDTGARNLDWKKLGDRWGQVLGEVVAGEAGQTAGV